MKSFCKKGMLSIVIPVYRSENILRKLIEEINSSINYIPNICDYEIILVNDASPDRSWSVICDIASTNTHVRGINLRKNSGQHNALMAGLNNVRGELVVTMDDDLQHPPSAISALLATLCDGYDVCYTRYLERKHARWKKIGSNFNNWVATRLIGKPPDLYLSSFRAMHREIVDEIIKYDGPFAYIDGLILDVTRSISSVEITHQSRYEGESNYTLGRLVSLWLKMATSFSLTPLRIATYFGFILSFLSFIFVIFVTVMKITHPNYPAGWASIMAAIFLVGGVQALCIGMIGEYLGRTYIKINRKRQFVIRETTWRK